MERLTEKCWRNLDPWECCGQDHFCRRGCHDLGGCTNGCIVPKLYARLAAYEDTGLEPKQAMLISNVLREVGETYNCWFDYVVNCVLENSHLKDLAKAEKDGRLVVLPFCVGSSLYEATGKGVWEYETEQFSIGSEDLFIHALDKVIWYRGGRIFGLDQIGKTVFLTREEAEAALKKEGEADNEAD